MILLDQVDVLLDNIYTIKFFVLILDVLLDNIYTIKIVLLLCLSFKNSKSLTAF